MAMNRCLHEYSYSKIVVEYWCRAEVTSSAMVTSGTYEDGALRWTCRGPLVSNSLDGAVDARQYHTYQAGQHRFYLDVGYFVVHNE